MNSSSRIDIPRLILVPALISLAVTVLRTMGEVSHWSVRWFEPVTRGILPSPFGWVFGITWLAAPFGIYFALRLSRMGHGPESRWTAFWGGMAGFIIGVFGAFFVAAWREKLLHSGLLFFLMIIWAVMVIAALVHLWTWPALFKTLLAYGWASRLPVVVVYFMAMRGNWGTHYDYVGTPLQFSMPLIPRYFWLAFFPQLVAWVAFTINVGTLAGVVAVAVARPKAKCDQP